MGWIALGDRIGAAYRRVGPGRLPGADRRDIGAGYAGASAALIATAAFSALVSRLVALGSPLGVADSAHVFAAGLALPFVVPAAFVAGVVAWRLLPEGTPLFGAVAGVVGTVLTYLGALALFGGFVLATVALSPSGAEPVDAVALAALVGYAAVVLTVWVTVPIGCLGGLVYERVGAAT